MGVIRSKEREGVDEREQSRSGIASGIDGNPQGRSQWVADMTVRRVRFQR